MVNKAIIIGNLGKDPEVRFTQGGQACAKFSVATSEKWTDKKGEKHEATEWHNIVVWGKQAETCGEYLSKGRQVYVEGRIATREYDDKDGNKRRVTEIIARDVRFLGGGGKQDGERKRTQPGERIDDDGQASWPPTDDDIPF